MNRSVSNIICIIVIGIIISTCANRGTITGGERDTEPPIILRSTPENFSTNFTGNEIKIYFNEYIKIKNLQKQLIISPPMNTQPEITPLGSASKFITIKIFDTLTPNTTYAFNFGESIVDNNEDNPYPFYKYVFSTGSYIDSLSVGGIILDAEKRKPEDFVSVMLYEVDSTFTDSVIYKKTPRYITNTLDSTTTFKIENLKAGKYLMIALKDENNSNKYEQKSDRIGFKKEYVTIPSDSIYSLSLFKEEDVFKLTRPKQVSGQKIAFGYEGDAENVKIKLLPENNATYFERITKDAKSDTLNYWFDSEIKSDSLLFSVTNNTFQDSMYVNIRDMKKDTLVLKAVPTGLLKFDQDFEIQANIPFTSIDEKQITILRQDSLDVTFSTQLDSLRNSYVFNFDKVENERYQIQMLPGTFTTIFEASKDTLKYVLRTRSVSDYGKVRITLNNAVYPVILQLTDAQDNIKGELYAEKPQFFDFNNLDAGTFYIRVIYDSNKNGKWDSGNYLKKIQPERIIYYPRALDVRSNWDVIEEFTLD